MDELDYKQLSEKIKLLAHPERLRILDALRREPECVCHLETLLGKSQPYVSQQLRLLREADVIVDEKDGLHVYYRLVDRELIAWLAVVLEPIEGTYPALQQHKPADSCPCPKCEQVSRVVALTAT
jgi:DNA-binding transcriptional ArsR family regulator